jgi:16S rRNA C967 or C1407 C5-methylase (RsmB/RsmF family)
VKSRTTTRRSQTTSAGSLPALLDGLLPEAECRELEQALTARPPKAIRLRPELARGRACEEVPPFPTRPVPWYPGGFLCPETVQPGRFLLHAAGGYFVQDAGSMLALRLLDARPGEWIADLCAAPGAKASAILETVGPGGGLLLANEPIRGRLPALAYNLARVGFPRFLITAADPDRLDPVWTGQFAAVLVDAPCTGQTLVGRGRQSAAAFTPSQIEHAAARQRRILTAAARLVQPGGRLVYSTCTFAPAENEQVVAAFLERHDGWHEEPLAILEPWRSPVAPGGYRLYPHRDRCAGGYAVRLRLLGQDGAPPARRRHQRGSLEPFFCGDEEVGHLQAGWLLRQDLHWEDWPAELMNWPSTPAGQASELAYRPARHWMPAHALALRRDDRWQPRQTMPLDDDQARQFLQGQTLPPGPCGWMVATWRGHPLGWLRGNRDRLNNGLPSPARLGFAAMMGAACEPSDDPGSQ